ncbi:21399_t:CDS:2, partial [Racocetra persica]
LWPTFSDEEDVFAEDVGFTDEINDEGEESVCANNLLGGI